MDRGSPDAGHHRLTWLAGAALLAATTEEQLVPAGKKARKPDVTGPTSQQISRMERELAALNAEREQLRAIAQARGIQ